MQYDDIIKKLLEGSFYDDNKYDPFKGRTADTETGGNVSKSTFEYTPSEKPEYDASEIEVFWEEYRDIIGKAIFSTPEELQKFMDLTEKVLVVPTQPQFAVAFPPEIALQMMTGEPGDVVVNLHNNYKIYLRTNELAKTERAPYGDSGVIGVSPFARKIKNLKLPSLNGDFTNDEAYLFDNWLDWLNEKRNEGWIIAGTDSRNISGV